MNKKIGLQMLEEGVVAIPSFYSVIIEKSA